jgi:hypothetical protein
MLAKPPAARLAQGSSPEKQSKAKTQGCSAAAFSLDEKRKEQQIAHARRSIERAYREEQVEAPAVLSCGLNFLLDRSNERLLRQKEKQHKGNHQSDRGC